MKNRTIIAVRGVANQGKSASIKHAYLLLTDLYPDAKINEINTGTDITVVMTINGKRVGIESQGDPNSRLFQSLDHFVSIGCKVIVCSTRSRGATVEAVNSLGEKFNIEWHQKQDVPSMSKQAEANRYVARQIVASVQAALET
jgi:hypothetical protein